MKSPAIGKHKILQVKFSMCASICNSGVTDIDLILPVEQFPRFMLTFGAVMDQCGHSIKWQRNMKTLDTGLTRASPVRLPD